VQGVNPFCRPLEPIRRIPSRLLSCFAVKKSPFTVAPQGANFEERPMIRHLVWIFVCLCCSGAMAAPEQKVSVGPACLYDSKSFSDGAYVCVQKSLMQVCTSDGTRAMWKAVADKDLNERCIAPMTLNYPPKPPPHGHRRHLVLHRIHPVAERSTNCFTFNGRQYCE
jgi:hypothetical protein